MKPFLLRLTDEEHAALMELSKEDEVSMQRVVHSVVIGTLVARKKLCPTCSRQPK